MFFQYIEYASGSFGRDGNLPLERELDSVLEGQIKLFNIEA